jgi:hypothetical protein
MRYPSREKVRADSSGFSPSDATTIGRAVVPISYDIGSHIAGNRLLQCEVPVEEFEP